MNAKYDLKVIRDLVNEAFDLTGLNDFCLFYFRAVYDEFVESDRKGERVRRLIEYAKRQAELDLLLSRIKEENPGKYNEFLPRLTGVPHIFNEVSPALSPYIHLQEFQALIEERTQNFIGRDFIFKAIDDFIEDPNFPSGYIVISGEPGIGKTALISQLVKQAGYVHHFNIASQNIRSHRDFLGNICAQLIARYKLSHLELPPEATQDSGFLSRLLSEAAQQEPNRPVIVLVDALDEAEDTGLTTSTNRLYLPPILPVGVPAQHVIGYAPTQRQKP
jgi:hypothetical protein